jgi:hypothetical protein
MRRIGAVLLAGSAILGAATVPAHAGDVAIDDDGNFLMTDVSMSPARTSTTRRPQPVTLELHQMFGNYRTGRQPPPNTRLTVSLPRGALVNAGFAGRCPLPTSQAQVRADRCPASSRIGGGDALADARNLGVPGPIPARLTAYNGAQFQGAPTFILQGVAQVGGNTIVNEFDFVIRRSGSPPFGLQAVSFDPFPSPPPAPGAGNVTLNELNLRIGKTVRRRFRGRRIPRGVIEAPRNCPRAGWSFASEFALEGGSVLNARDTSPCRRR